jgi:YVTN family beta-propeller protein
MRLARVLIAAFTSIAACASEPGGPRLYVTNEISGDISVVDLRSSSVIATIPVGKRPRGVRVSPDGTTLYVALSGSPIAGPGVDEDTLPPPDRRFDGIGVIDVRSGKLLRTIAAGTDPEQLAVTTNGARLFVANEDAGEVSVVDVAAGNIVRRIPVGGEPEGVDLSPDGRWVYVTSEEDNQVAVIDTESLAVVAMLPVGARPRSTGFLPDGSRAYVSAENDRCHRQYAAPRPRPYQDSRRGRQAHGCRWLPGRPPRVRQHRQREDGGDRRREQQHASCGDRSGCTALGYCCVAGREVDLHGERSIQRRVDRRRRVTYDHGASESRPSAMGLGDRPLIAGVICCCFVHACSTFVSLTLHEFRFLNAVCSGFVRRAS